MKKRTKIVATISDRRCEVDFIKKLHDKGMDVVRLNTAHQTLEDSLRIVENVRKVSDKIPLMIDTKGPEIRTTKAAEEINVKTGDRINVKGNPDKESTRECICVAYVDFVKDLSIGNSILIDDGEVELVVEEKNSEELICRVQNDGSIESRKSINVPGVHINLPSLSTKDLTYIDFAIKHDIDFVAHSFVRNKEDVIEIQNILDVQESKVKIIAKIESQSGVDNIDEILKHAYGVMVARGDLGIEIPMERIPVIQNILVQKCIAHKKPVIIATQMLHTMIKNPRPTRAEVSDIATAIYLGTDAIMLSGETAYGDYPFNAVETMTKIAVEAEKDRTIPKNVDKIDINRVAIYLANCAYKASLQLPTKAVVLDTLSGKTGRYMAAFRGENPVFAMCYNKRIVRELGLSFGVYAEYMEPRETTDKFLKASIELLLKKNLIDIADLIVHIAGHTEPGRGATFLDINAARNMI